MLTITRRLALQLKSVMRRAFGNVRHFAPVLCFTAGAVGPRVRARSGDTAVEYGTSTASGEGTLWLPFQFLADCAAKRDDPVQLEAAGQGRVTAQWRDRGVPQLVQYEAEAPADAAEFPAFPETLAENPPELLQALAEASETTNPNPVRFAVDCLQLGAPGSIAASDGRHLLIQGGFQFPWHDDLLIRSSNVFTSRELPDDQPVQIGRAGNWVAVGVKPWTVYQTVNVDGRFPNVFKHIPRPDDIKARCTFSPADAEFLAESLPRLPSNDAHDSPVTLELNGQISIRAKPADSPRPTEVVLAGSSYSGDAIRVTTNRQYLIRALRLGFRELSLTGPEDVIACFDAQRQYLWMPLNPTIAIPPAADVIRIDSSAAGSNATTPQPQKKRSTSPVSETTSNANGNGQADANGQAKTTGQVRKSRGRKAGQQDIENLIEQAENLRGSLRDTLNKTSELVKSLKRHRRSRRLLQSTLHSLQELKTLGI